MLKEFCEYFGLRLFSFSLKKYYCHCLQFKRHFYIKIFASIIPTTSAINLHLLFSFPLVKPKTFFQQVSGLSKKIFTFHLQSVAF